jgi:hypothetical protein
MEEEMVALQANNTLELSELSARKQAVGNSSSQYGISFLGCHKYYSNLGGCSN